MHFCILGQQQHFSFSSLLLNSIYKFIYLYNHYYCLSSHGRELGVPPAIKRELIYLCSGLFSELKQNLLTLLSYWLGRGIILGSYRYRKHFTSYNFSVSNLLEIILKTCPFISSFHVHSSISDHLISALHSECKDYTFEMILNPVTTFSFLLNVSVPFS